MSGIAAIKSTANAVVAISITATILTALNTSLNPSKRAALHKSAANEYNKLKNEVRIFREILTSNFDFTDKTLIEKLTSYSDRRNQLNSSSPNIPRWAYEKTQRDVNQGFTKYNIDKE
ncbi:SLATT domain-containing protein [Escherichia coli]